ncbi:hypothetical protein L211DRAFT_851016 [Terfezia boudieri ATCC MYA-4762]|uniref:Uncharacterized protein n=1 Tax=Terfezia boudieri ATCC MYA-4762 TaxID=1051890 RepID=A0A3N4LKP1_9PEZI|nr:hypothetical protein L211DRAFT_851016 [Terfezia boudieri ATCC MYA-4762]
MQIRIPVVGYELDSIGNPSRGSCFPNSAVEHGHIVVVTRPHAVTGNRQKGRREEEDAVATPTTNKAVDQTQRESFPLPSTSTLTPQATKSTTYDLTAVIPQPYILDMTSPLTSGDPWCGVWTMMVQPGVNWVSSYIFKVLEYLFGNVGNLRNPPSLLTETPPQAPPATPPIPPPPSLPTATPPQAPPVTPPIPPPPSLPTATPPQAPPATPPIPPPPSPPPVPPLPPPPRPNPELDTLRELLESFIQASATERSEREAERVAEREARVSEREAREARERLDRAAREEEREAREARERSDRAAREEEREAREARERSDIAAREEERVAREQERVAREEERVAREAERVTDREAMATDREEWRALMGMMQEVMAMLLAERRGGHSPSRGSSEGDGGEQGGPSGGQGSGAGSGGRGRGGRGGSGGQTGRGGRGERVPWRR